MEAKIKDPILYVDDEPENLEVFKFGFRNEFEIYYASNGDEALKILENNFVKVVVTDQRMPNMLGTDLLKIIAEKYPLVIRILLTAYTDTDSMVKAINRGEVYRFITKPWNRQELTFTLQKAIEVYNLKDENQHLFEDLKTSNSKLEQINERLLEENKQRKVTEEQLKKINDELKSFNEELSQKNKLIKEINFRLGESEEKFRQLAENTNDYFILQSMNNDILYISPRFEDIWEQKMDPLFNNPRLMSNWIHPDDIVSVEEALTKPLTKNTEYQDVEFRIVAPSGRNKWLWYREKTITDIDGVPYRKVGIGVDITDEKENEIQLTLYKEHLENLVEERTEEVKKINAELLTTNEELNSTNEELLATNNQLKEEITERNKAEAALTESEEKFRSFVEQSSEGILLLNDKGTILLWNKAMTDIFGVDREEYLNKPVWEFQYTLLSEEQKHSSPIEKNRLRYMKLVENSKYKRGLFFENKVYLKDKTNKYIRISVFSINMQSSKYIGCIIHDITEKRKLDMELEMYRSHLEELVKNRTEELYEREERLRTLSDNLPEGLIFRGTRSHSGRIEINYISANSEQILGVKPQDLINKSLDSIITNIPKEDIARIIEKLNSPKKSLEVVEVELKYSKPGSHMVWLHLKTKPHKDKNNQLIYDGYILDITSRKLSEEALKQSEQNYREIFNSSNDAIFIHDAETGEVLDVNDTMCKIYECSRKDALQKGLGSFGAYEDPYKPDVALKWIQKVRNSGPQNFEWRSVKLKSGSPFWVEVSLKPITLAGQLRLMAVVRDISEQKLAEIKIKQASDIFQYIQTGLHIYRMNDLNDDRSLVMVNANPATEKLTGIKVPDVIGKSIDENFPGLREKGVPQLYAEVVRTKIPKEIEDIYYKDDRVIEGAFSVTAFPLPDDHVGVSFENITQRKKAELALKDSEEKFRNIYNTISDGIAITGMDMFIRDVNLRLREMMGYIDDDHTKLKPTDFVPEIYLNQITENIAELIRTNNMVGGEYEVFSKSGILIPVEISTKLIDYQGEKAMLSVIHDIRDRKQLEKKVLEAIIKTEEREREKFARNLHDDLGPLLSSIKMYVNSIGDAHDSKRQQYINNQLNEIVKEAIQTTKEISNDLSPHILINYGLISAVESFIDRVSEHIEVTLRTNCKETRFQSIIETSIYRIIKELVNNTMKHANAKTISIEIYDESSLLQLIYFDDGTGIKKTKLEEPSGKNMGLSNIISRIKSLNGKYKISNKNNKGYLFELEVPI